MAVISTDEASWALWFYGEAGYAPGSFTRYLMETISRADATNRMRLRSVYPGLVAAMETPVSILQIVANGGEAEPDPVDRGGIIPDLPADPEVAGRRLRRAVRYLNTKAVLREEPSKHTLMNILLGRDEP